MMTKSKKIVNTPPGYISKQDAAKKLLITAQSLYNYEARGWIPKAQKISGFGHVSFYLLSDFEALSKKLGRK